MIERIAQIIERQIDDYPTVLADPMTIRKIRANKLAQAVLTELSAGDGVQECDRELAEQILGLPFATATSPTSPAVPVDRNAIAADLAARHRTLAAAAERARIVIATGRALGLTQTANIEAASKDWLEGFNHAAHCMKRAIEAGEV